MQPEILLIAYCLLPVAFFIILSHSSSYCAEAILRYRSIIRLSRSVFSTSRFRSSPRIKPTSSPILSASFKNC